MVKASAATGNAREIGRRLKDTRHRCELSQVQIAVILGVSNIALSRWEHGNRNPRAKHWEQISRWLQQVGQVKTG